MKAQSSPRAFSVQSVSRLGECAVLSGHLLPAYGMRPLSLHFLILTACICRLSWVFVVHLRDEVQYVLMKPIMIVVFYRKCTGEDRPDTDFNRQCSSRVCTIYSK